MGDIVDYLASRGIPRATLGAVAAVMKAIVDADDGVSSPFFSLCDGEAGVDVGRRSRSRNSRECSRLLWNVAFASESLRA